MNLRGEGLGELSRIVRKAQISNLPWRCDELQTLDLSEVSGISEHVDVEELCDIVVPCERI